MKKPAEKNEGARLKAVLDKIAEAVLEIDSNNKVTAINSAAESILGIKSSELLGGEVFTLTDKLSPDIGGSSLSGQTSSEAIKNRDPNCSGFCRFKRKDEKTILLSWKLSKLESGADADKRLLTISDLTEKQSLSTALLQQREDFLALLNHRLRTPLIAAHRMIKLILDEQYGELNERQREVIELLEENLTHVDRLNLMIVDIYRYRTHSKELNLSDWKVEDLLSKVLNSTKESRVPISSEIQDPDLRVRCDRTEIVNLINHLVDNASKHAKTGVRINIENTVSGDCVISVEDDGKGIAERDIQELFDRFFVVSSEGRYAPVTGAGLCLCSEIARAHGGKISCSSKPGILTRFEVRLPGLETRRDH